MLRFNRFESDSHAGQGATVLEPPAVYAAGNGVKLWNTLKTTYKVSDLIGWHRDGTLQLNPDFQRKSVWKTGAKSYLIDTILRGLPIPIIILRDKRVDLTTFAPLRDVVDGQQRLRTVIAYIDPLSLVDYDQTRDVFKVDRNHNTEYAGKSFSELPREAKTRILDYQFTVNVFPSDTDDREVRDVFLRMNSSGYKLNNQELRNATYFGAFRGTAQRLAGMQLDRWRNWKIFSSDNLARMGDIELVSELIILMVSGVSEKTGPTINAHYKAMDKAEAFSEREEVEDRFQHTFDVIGKSIGDDNVRSLFRKRTMFYGLYGAVYKHLYGFGEHKKLARPKVQKLSLPGKVAAGIIEAGAHVADKSAPPLVVDASTKATTHIRERTRLITYLLS